MVLNPATLPDGLDDVDYMRICMAMVDAADLAVFLPGLPREPGRHGGMGVMPEDREGLRPVPGYDGRETAVKNFVEAYREARAKEWKYMDAKRAGWAEPGKRTRENHAILVPRREAMEMADELPPTFTPESYT